MVEDAIGIFFGILIGICGVLILIFPTRRYWKMVSQSLLATTYTTDQYNNKNPNSGAVKGTIHTTTTQHTPLSGRPCILYKIKERTRNYHSSGASKLTTKETYTSLPPFKLLSESSYLKIHTDENTEFRLTNTIKKKLGRGNDIPRSLQKHRNKAADTITETDYTEMVPMKSLRNVQFIGKMLRGRPKHLGHL